MPNPMVKTKSMVKSYLIERSEIQQGREIGSIDTGRKGRTLGEGRHMFEVHIEERIPTSAAQIHNSKNEAAPNSCKLHHSLLSALC
mmetsp:Transcript_20799/g.31233  ORF Transcript_20799/g.31233 Transcript_20799/m.31233 type:complete len:86 (+) Transcript_20799:1720-1977(+)